MNESSHITYEEHLHSKLKPERVNEWLSIVSTWCALSRGRKLKHHTNTVYADLLQIVIKGAYKWFLWHQKICQFLFDFSITHKRRLRKMLILKCLCVVLFCLKFNRIRSPCTQQHLKWLFGCQQFDYKLNYNSQLFSMKFIPLRCVCCAAHLIVIHV